VVGEGGFEPPTSCSQSRCPTELGHSPFFWGPDQEPSLIGPVWSLTPALRAHMDGVGGPPMDSVGELDRFARPFARHLKAENKSPMTVETYVRPSAP
jgi:hypothetical protein